MGSTGAAPPLTVAEARALGVAAGAVEGPDAVLPSVFTALRIAPLVPTQGPACVWWTQSDAELRKATRAPP